MALNEKRDALIVECMTSGVIWSRAPGNVTKRDAHLADLVAFDVQTFYATQDGPNWLVVFFDKGNEQLWGSFPEQGRADKTVLKLNELLAGGWNPNL